MIVPQHVVEALVYSALFRADRKSIRTLSRLGLIDRAVIYAPEARWFLTRHYGSAQQRKEKARARQRENGITNRRYRPTSFRGKH
jgi:hypothetical protein